MRVKGHVSYTETGRVFVPENKITIFSSKMSFVALRGYSASMAVMEGGRCIGWVDTRDLGHENVKSYLASGCSLIFKLDDGGK